MKKMVTLLMITLLLAVPEKVQASGSYFAKAEMAIAQTAFPQPEEVEPISIPMQELSSESTLLWIRCGVLGVTSIVVIAYAVYYQKAMKEWKGEE